MALPSPRPTEQTWKETTLSSPIFGGQLSPVESVVGDAGQDDATPMTSAAARLTARRSEYLNRQAVRDVPRWPGPESMKHDGPVQPKIEPVDDEVNLDQVIAATSAQNGEFKQKRSRGRPRKHPLPTSDATSKVGKGRSKTGCITCRKRKKKCDEAKPRCKRARILLLAWRPRPFVLTCARYELREECGSVRGLPGKVDMEEREREG